MLQEGNTVQHCDARTSTHQHTTGCFFYEPTAVSMEPTRRPLIKCVSVYVSLEQCRENGGVELARTQLGLPLGRTEEPMFGGEMTQF